MMNEFDEQKTVRGVDERKGSHWLWKGVATGFAIFLAVVVLTVLNNNYSLHRTSRAEFSARLHHAIDASTQWMVEHPFQFEGNPPQMFMVADMGSMSGDPRLRQMLDQYRSSEYVTSPFRPFAAVWARLVDPHAQVPIMDCTGAPTGDIFELLWDAYAVAPDRVLISDAQRKNMFSPTKYYWGRRHHQLLALDMYRYYNGGSEELNGTINHLAEKIARDAHFDFRVNDSYVQRSAFILAAQRPDLIRARWIERILDYQRADGSWATCWYGWCKGVFEFRRGDVDPAHATVQAAWALYQIKYRYPQWIEERYR